MTAAPPLGANGTMAWTSAPEAYSAIGGPGTLVIARSQPFIIPDATEVAALCGRAVSSR